MVRRITVDTPVDKVLANIWVEGEVQRRASTGIEMLYITAQTNEARPRVIRDARGMRKRGMRTTGHGRVFAGDYIQPNEDPDAFDSASGDAASWLSRSRAK